MPRATRSESRSSSRGGAKDTAKALAASELRFSRHELIQKVQAVLNHGQTNSKPQPIRIPERSASIGIRGGTRLMVLMGLLALITVAGVAYVTVRISGTEPLGLARHLRWALVVTAILFGAASLVLGFRRTRAKVRNDTR